MAARGSAGHGGHVAAGGGPVRVGTRQPVGRWRLDGGGRFSRPEGTGPWLLRLGGLATVADVWINGGHRLRSESMRIGHELEIDELRADGNEILIRCEALGPLLKTPRKPRAGWRTRLVDDQNLRWFRTSFLGRMPGWSPRP